MSEPQVATTVTIDPSLLPVSSAQKRFEAKVVQTERRNFQLGLWNGILYALGVSFMSRTTIVPAFLSHLTTSSALIGIVSQFENIGWYLPQLFFSTFVIHRKQKMPLYKAAAALRSTAFLLIAGITLLHPQESILLLSFIIVYGAYHLGSGMGGVVFMELLAKAIPQGKRGRFLGLRISIGAILTATIGASLTTLFLSTQGFPQSFGYLFLVGAILASIGLYLMAVMREPRNYDAPGRRSVRDQFRIGFSFLKTDKRFRYYLEARLVLSAWTIGVPFLVLFAERELRFHIADIGLFVAAECIGQVISNFFWERITDRRSPKATMLVATALAILLPLLLFAFLYLKLPIYLYAIVFGISAAVDSGISVGGMSYLIEITPNGERATYVGLFNSLMAFPCFLTAGAGLILDLLGFTPLYAIVLLLGIWGYILVQRLDGRRPNLAV